MPGSTFTLKIDDTGAAEELRRLAELGDAREVLPRLGEYLQRATEGRFKSQTAPDGTPWAPLQPAYARRKKYARDKILTLRGYLRGTIRYQVEDAHAVSVGTDRPYGRIHQLGGTIEHAARSQQVRLRRVRITREDGTTYTAVRFAKKAHKRAEQKWGTNGSGWSVTIPARPFLGVSAADETALAAILRDWAAGKG